MLASEPLRFSARGDGQTVVRVAAKKTVVNVEGFTAGYLRGLATSVTALRQAAKEEKEKEKEEELARSPSSPFKQPVMARRGTTNETRVQWQGQSRVVKEAELQALVAKVTAQREDEEKKRPSTPPPQAKIVVFKRAF